MDCCGFKVSDLEMETLLSLTVGVILSIVAYYWVHRQNPFKRSATTNSSSTSTCSSPNCVRCNEGVTERIARTAIELFETNAVHFKATERIKQSVLNRKSLVDELSLTKSLQQPNVLYVPDLLAEPSLQRNVYKSDVAFLEDHYEEFLDEFKDVMGLLDGWTVNSVPTGQWKVFYLINQGNYVAENCSLCPKTTAFIYRLDNLMAGCLFGNVGFSVLDPGTYVPEHFGPTNARVRCQLGLVIPDDCQLKVGNLTLEWEERKCLLFDDSFSHSVRHGGSVPGAARVILLVDLWHPSLTNSEREVLQRCYASEYRESNKCKTD